MRAGSVVAIIMALAACRGRDAPPLLPADPPTPMATRGAAQSTLLDSGSTTLAGFGSRWTGDLDAMIDRRYIRALVLWRVGEHARALDEFWAAADARSRQPNWPLLEVFHAAARDEVGLTEGDVKRRVAGAAEKKQ